MAELLFLGTGAADWTMEDKVPGKEFRRNSAALLDKTVMLDCGSYIFDLARAFWIITLFSCSEKVAFEKLLNKFSSASANCIIVSL